MIVKDQIKNIINHYQSSIMFIAVMLTVGIIAQVLSSLEGVVR